MGSFYFPGVLTLLHKLPSATFLNNHTPENKEIVSKGSDNIKVVSQHVSVRNFKKMFPEGERGRVMIGKLEVQKR